MAESSQTSTALSVPGGKKFFKLGLLGVGVLVLLWAVGGYNGLVSQKATVDQRWAAVQSEYQRRSDLVDNLVKTVQGSADFEKSTLESVINARAKATQVTVNPENLDDLKKFNEAQGELSSTLSRLLVVSEQYPDLKSTEAFLGLQSQLEGTENRINVSRKDYSLAVKDYNVRVKKFPTVILANLFGYDERPQFEATSDAQSAPTVEFKF